MHGPNVALLLWNTPITPSKFFDIAVKIIYGMKYVPYLSK